MIPITLEFSSSVPDKYRLNGATYDRSGRLPTEEFVLDRDDVVDPLVDYFGAGVIGGLAGGGRVNPILGPEPHLIDLLLNDWFRLDTPGRYRLYLKSHRPVRERFPSEPGEELVDFAAVSNVLEIEVLKPDPAWEDRKLAELQAILDPRDGGLEKQEERPDRRWKQLDSKVMRATSELTYLGTPGAVQLILRLARRDSNELIPFGLIGSPHRAFVIGELDRYIEDPETVMTQGMVQLRVLFDYIIQASPKPIPMPWEYRRVDWVKLRPELEARQKLFDGMVQRRAAGLVPVIARKSATVRKECVETIVALAPEEAKAAGLVPPDNYGLTRDQLIAQFDEFPEDRQSALLSEKWGLVRGPEILPALRRLVDRTAPKPLPGAAVAYLLWHGARTLPEMALERILEYAPEEGRQTLLGDITSLKPRFPEFAVHELPAQDVPKADVVLAENFKTNPSGTIPLAAKFGSSALADQLHSAYEKRSWLCEEEAWFVAYFVRVLSAAEGKDALRRALEAREKRGCFRSLLGYVAGIVWNRVVEQQAIENLSDPDPETVADAARAFSIHGDAPAESLLWRRLEQWSGKWRGREKELGPNPITGAQPNRGEKHLGDTLINSIAESPAWFLDGERSRRLASLCLDDWCRTKWLKEASGAVPVNAQNGGSIYGRVFRVAQYSLTSLKELKEKMAQFPAGETFRWCPQVEFDAFLPEERQEMYTDLAQFLAHRAMRIEPYSKEACSPR